MIKRRGVAAVAAAGVLGALLVPNAGPSASAAPATIAADATPAAFDPTLIDQLEAALDQGFAEADVPGVIIGVWIPGYGEWVSQRGVADLTNDAPMARGNQQKIGSITKSFVGIVALQLISSGEYDLTLDSTIDRWYPDIPDASQITVRMLLNMSSGIGNSPLGQVERICADPYATPTPDEVIDYNLEYPQMFAPGTGFDYANVNFYVAGRILEQVTGKDIETLIREGITDPLGMSRSRLAGDGQLVAPLVHGYTNMCPELPPLTDTFDWPGNEEWAGGAMVSTLDDLHTFGDALGSGELLTPEAHYTQIHDSTPRGDGSSFYGIGVQVINYPDSECVMMLQHAGAEPGYQSNLLAFPDTGATMAILANGNDRSPTPTLDAVLYAVYPLLKPHLEAPSTEPCEDPATPTSTTTTTVVPVAAVAVDPRYVG